MKKTELEQPGNMEADLHAQYRGRYHGGGSNVCQPDQLQSVL